MAEEQKNEIFQRLTKNFLDIQLLRIIKNQPSWGYEIKKKTEDTLKIKLRHSLLYPTLNLLEKQGYVSSQIQEKDGRRRKIYQITSKGNDYLQVYYQVIKDQIQNTPKI